MFEKLKPFLTDDAIYYSLLVVLIGVVSFGLGKHSMSFESVGGTPATITLSQESVKSTSSDKIEEVVVSKNGTKFHYLWCPGASQIKEENKLFFEDYLAAEAAGYTKAANCNGF